MDKEAFDTAGFTAEAMLCERLRAAVSA